MPYHAWAGTSMTTPTTDGRHHAVDWYVQGAQQFLTGRYLHFVLVDVYEPTDWYRAQSYVRRGHFSMLDPPPYQRPPLSSM